MIVGVIAIAALTLDAKRVAMFEERKIQIRTAVELAVVAQYFRKSPTGEMISAQAQELAKRAIGFARWRSRVKLISPAPRRPCEMLGSTPKAFQRCQKMQAFRHSFVTFSKTLIRLIAILKHHKRFNGIITNQTKNDPHI